MPPFVPRKRHRSQSPAAAPLSKKTHKPPKNRQNIKKPVLFEQADSSRRSVPTLEENMAFLAQQAEEDDEDDDEDSDDSSKISDLDSDEFEDVLPTAAPKRQNVAQSTGPSTARRRGLKGSANDSGDDDADEDEDMEWEDATGHQTQPEPAISGDLHLTLDEIPEASIGTFTNPHAQKKGPSKIERGIRINTHCMHVQCLLFHNYIRNRWIGDKEVQKILVGGLPPNISKEVEKFQKSVGVGQDEHRRERASDNNNNNNSNNFSKGKGREKKTSKQHKNQRDWGHRADHVDPDAPAINASDPTIRLLRILCSFWRKKFTIAAPGLRKQGYKDLTRLEKEVRSFKSDEHDIDEHGERVENVEKFRQLAKSCKGSRDVGAQLFTSLLRGVGLEARMVNNLQPVGFGWSKNEEALPRRNKPKSASQIPGKQKDKKNTEPPIRPRTKPRSNHTTPQKSKLGSGGAKSQPIDISDDSDDSGLSAPPDSDDDSILDITPSDLLVSSRRYDRDLPFPVYWTEVLSPIAQTWIPVDPVVLSIVATQPEAVAQFEPRGARADKAKQVFAYVIAFSSDGSAKDVTVRYLKRHMWPGKTKGVRFPAEKVPIYNKHGKVKRYEEYDWFKTVMSCFTRSSEQRTTADDIEEARDLQAVKINRDGAKAGEETLQGYKNSAEFVLERHLRREEALLPGAKEVRKFTTGKGDKAKTEPVFLRKDVVTCRTAESWHKQGRQVKDGEQALKQVPMRAVTTIRKREIEEVERETGEKQKQGLFSWDQTDWIIPEPIRNGVIPKNAFGNMDVYVPSMVPAGGIHIPLRGTAKVCRRLEIDYAEACTGFEFGNRMAVPILTGVVVAKENEHLVIDAWEAEMAEKRKKEEAKREKIALGMWKKMLAGLKVIERVRKEYGDAAETEVDAILRQHVGKKEKRISKFEKVSHDAIVLTDEEDEKTGHLTHAEFAKAAQGGGGFMTADDGAGGFLNDQDDDNDAKPGGFTLDAGDSHDSPAKSRAPVTSEYLNTPTYLEPTQLPSSMDEDGVGDKSIKTTANKKAQKHTSNPLKRSSVQTPAKNKPVITPPESDQQSNSDDAAAETPGKIKRNVTKKQRPQQASRTVGRRNAARKSAEATRSHYFEVDTDNDDED